MRWFFTLLSMVLFVCATLLAIVRSPDSAPVILSFYDAQQQELYLYTPHFEHQKTIALDYDGLDYARRCIQCVAGSVSDDHRWLLIRIAQPRSEATLIIDPLLERQAVVGVPEPRLALHLNDGSPQSIWAGDNYVNEEDFIDGVAAAFGDFADVALPSGMQIGTPTYYGIVGATPSGGGRLARVQLPDTVQTFDITGSSYLLEPGMIISHEDADGHFHIYELSNDAARLQQTVMLPDVSASRTAGLRSVMRNGRWLVFQSDFVPFVQLADSYGEYPVRVVSGDVPLQWSSDGRYLLTRTPHSQLYVIDLQRGASVQTNFLRSDRGSINNLHNLSLSDDVLFYSDGAGLYRMTVDDRPPQFIMDMPADLTISGLSISTLSPDIAMISRGGTSITVDTTGTGSRFQTSTRTFMNAHPVPQQQFAYFRLLIMPGLMLFIGHFSIIKSCFRRVYGIRVQETPSFSRM